MYSRDTGRGNSREGGGGSKACSDPPAPPPCHPASPAASRACRPGPPQVRRGAAGSALVGQRPLGPRDLLPYPCGDPRRLRPRGLPPPPQLHLHENDDRFNYHRYSSDGKTCQHPRSPCRPPRRGRGRVLGGRAEEGAACKATRFCALPAAASIACRSGPPQEPHRRDLLDFPVAAMLAALLRSDAREAAWEQVRLYPWSQDLSEALKKGSSVGRNTWVTLLRKALKRAS